MTADSVRNTSVLYIGRPEDKLLLHAERMACTILGVSADKLKGYQDYFYYGLADDEKVIGVEKAKEIVNHSFLSTSSGMKVVVIDHMDKMTVEAQNKLLKTIEEANVIIIGLSYDDNILPTLMSRMRVIRVCDRHRGYPGDVHNILDQIRECLESSHDGNYLDLFRILGLVKEKDPQSFFVRYREYIPDLIDMMTKAIADMQLLNTDKDYAGLLANLCKESSSCSNIRYSKEDFYEMVVGVVESLEGEYK